MYLPNYIYLVRVMRLSGGEQNYGDDSSCDHLRGKDGLARPASARDEEEEMRPRR